MPATIDPRRLAELRDTGRDIELIDVRTPAEFREVHVEFARSLPLTELAPEALVTRHGGPASEPLYVICRSGGRSQQACEKLAKAGLRVVNVEGGTQAWEAAGLPVVRGRSAISLERQVRIAAGSLVVLGSALGYFVNPVWIGLAAFVGAGLVFAGVTDTCGMGLLLARMPWNQVRAANTLAGGACSAKSPG